MATKDDSAPLIEWRDGTLPVSRLFDDPYFSLDNGQAETRHVFIDGNRLRERLAASDTFSIAELGFGTGLNMLEAWALWREVRRPDAKLTMTSFELHPLSRADMARALTHWPGRADLAAAMMDAMPDHFQQGLDHAMQLDAQTTLTVMIGDASERVLAWQGKADAWFLDGFSPAKNPALWTSAMMAAVFDHTVPGGTAATYSAAGHVRRALADAGFAVERAKGYGHKRHMTKAEKPGA